MREEERIQKDKQYDKDIETARANANGDSTDPQYRETVEKIRGLKEKDAKKDRKLTKKQDKVLFVSFYILLNLAEDVNVERKMVKQNLIGYLIDMLPRRSADLLILTVTFLKKLSLFAQNKNIMRDAGIVSKLSSFLPCSSEALVSAALRLEFNLSFDTDIREKIIECGHLPKLVTLLKTGAFRARTLKVLYHVSVDDRCKSMLPYTDITQLLMGLLINFPQPQLTRDLAGLAINAAWNVRIAEQMVSNQGINYLMDRMDNSRDPLLMKIIRTLSQWTFDMQQELDNPELQYRFRGLWATHVKTICNMGIEAPNHDLLIEILGTLANLTTLDLPGGWVKVMKDYHIFGLISKLLVPGMSQPDMLLEVIMLLSACAVESKTCDMIVSSNVMNQLYQLWKDKAADDVELLLQLMHCFYRLLLNDSTRRAAMYDTGVVSDSIEYLSHSNLSVSQMAESIASVVIELDREPGTQALGVLGLAIRAKRFESYNDKWLQAVGIEVDMKNWNGVSEFRKVPVDNDYLGGDAVVRMSKHEEIMPWREGSAEAKSFGRGGDGKYDDEDNSAEDSSSPGGHPSYSRAGYMHGADDDDRSYVNAGGGGMMADYKSGGGTEWSGAKWK